MPDPDAPRPDSRNQNLNVDELTNHVLESWRRQLRRVADNQPRTGDRGETERLLVSALLRASSSDTDEILPGLASAAARYGAGQQRERLDPGGLCEELASLRQIVWDELKQSDPTVRSAVDRILRFDRALSIVVKAAVTAGYQLPGGSGEPWCAESEPIDDERPPDS
jgi:hypothetical protein